MKFFPFFLHAFLYEAPNSEVAPATPPESGTNLPQIVTYIPGKAIFRYTLKFTYIRVHRTCHFIQPPTPTLSLRV